MSECLGLDFFHSIFALGIFYQLKHFVHFGTKELKTIYYKSKLRLEARLIRTLEELLEKDFANWAIDPELK